MKSIEIYLRFAAISSLRNILPESPKASELKSWVYASSYWIVVFLQKTVFDASGQRDKMDNTRKHWNLIYNTWTWNGR